MYSNHVSTMLLRRFSGNQPPTATRSLFVGQSRYFGKFGGYGRRLGSWLREQRVQVARACTRQFEFIAAQRVRRSIQLFHLYTRMWDEVALREFMMSWRRRMARNTREFLVSAVGVTVYNWDGEKISDEELRSYSKEIDGIYKLREATVVCDKCHLRLVIDVTQPGVEYCTCQGPKSSYASLRKEIDWQPFIERKDMLVWRKEEPESGGLYAYKVFGSYSDVSAQEFLQVQVDVDYRKEWDPTAKRLEIIDSDPRFKDKTDRQSDVVYWEMTWPRLFSNRDYVFERRWVVDRDRGVVVIVSKVTNHPKAPSRPDTYRVTTYWSYMVIKPCGSLEEPGIEFGLTYFDDPGVNISSAVTAWVAISGLPDFLCRMREAAKEYKAYKLKKQDVNVSEEILLEERSEVVEESEVKESVEEARVTLLREPEAEKEGHRAQTPQEKRVGAREEDRDDKYEDQETENEEEAEEIESQSTGSSAESKSEQEHGYLKYFFLTKLFA